MGKKLVTSRQIKSLQFSNPGRFMEDFDPENSQREMRKVQRRLYRNTRRGNKWRVFDDQGLRVSDGRDVCDCLNADCPGCHMPCPRCSSCKCGAECRVNRTWYYAEVETEGGPRLKAFADMQAHSAVISQLARRVVKCQL